MSGLNKITQEQAVEIALAFFSKAMRVDIRRVRATLKSGITYVDIVVGLELGCRYFEVQIIRNRNLIKLSEISTKHKFAYDNRNPQNGFSIKPVKQERHIKSEMLSNFYPAERSH